MREVIQRIIRFIGICAVIGGIGWALAGHKKGWGIALVGAFLALPGELVIGGRYGRWGDDSDGWGLFGGSDGDD